MLYSPVVVLLIVLVETPLLKMDKYDQLIESERDYEEEDYFYEQSVRDGVETKEKQERLCWKLRKARNFPRSL